MICSATGPARELHLLTDTEYHLLTRDNKALSVKKKFLPQAYTDTES